MWHGKTLKTGAIFYFFGGGKYLFVIFERSEVFGEGQLSWIKVNVTCFR